MVRTVVDFSNVEDQEFASLGPGTYRTVIDKIEKKLGSQSGEPMVVVEYKVTEGKQKNRRIMDFMSLSQKALWKMKQRLGEWGVSVKKQAYSIDWEDFVGTPILVQLGEARQIPKTNIMADTIIATSPISETDESEPETEEEAEVEPEVKRPKKKLSAVSEDEEEPEEEEAEELPIKKKVKVKVKAKASEDEEGPEEEEEEEPIKPRKLKVTRLR